MQRAQIAQFTDKFGIENKHLVPQLSLLSVVEPSEDNGNMSPALANDRIKDYHKQTAERRKAISEKMAVKR